MYIKKVWFDITYGLFGIWWHIEIRTNSRQKKEEKSMCTAYFSNGKVLHDSMMLDDDYDDECQIWKPNNIVTHIWIYYLKERELADRGCTLYTFIVSYSIFYDSAKGATNNIEWYCYNFNLIEKGNATTKAHRNFFLSEIRSFHSLFPQ